MSEREAEAIVARLWPGQDASIEALQGGITNRNYLIDVAGERGEGGDRGGHDGLQADDPAGRAPLTAARRRFTVTFSSCQPSAETP